MQIYLLRHGETQYNVEKRYQGTLDVPLSEKGLRELCRAEIDAQTVYVSPLCRATQTARVLFPHARQCVVEDFREMCFGSFQGRNYIEMERDAAYRAWVAGNCLGKCPDGESRAEFSARTCKAFEALADKAFAQGEQQLVILAHGGTQMAVMERYAQPQKNYYEWCGSIAGGFLLLADAAAWAADRTLQCADTVQYKQERCVSG